MTMKRALLHFVRRCVPELAKAPLRAPVHRLREMPRGAEPNLEEMADGTIVFGPARGPRLRLVSSAREAALFQFWSDPASADEMRQFQDLAPERLPLFDVGSDFGLFATIFALGGREAGPRLRVRSSFVSRHSRARSLQ